MQEAGRSDRTPEVIAETAAGMLLIGAMVFGGGPRGGGDAIVHLLALPALTLALLRWRPVAAGRLQRLFAWWLLAAAAVIGLQLLPLPADVFAALPQRAAVLADLHAAGAAPAWLPMTLDPWGTLRALLALGVFAATALLTLTLSQPARQRLLMLLLLAAVPMALLGFAQAAAGTHSELRFHGYHHPVGAIGAFANRNHFADLLGLLLPFALVFAVAAQRGRRQALAAAWYALAVILLLATALSFSRAGIVLAVAGLVASVLLLRPAAPSTRGRALPLLALGAAVLAVATYAWDGIAARLAQDPVDDLRWQYLRHGLDTLIDQLPWGSGLGSFRWVYAPHEPLAAMVGVYADRAHNDLLQLGIEAGVPGLLLLLALLVLLAAAATAALRRGGSADPHAALGKAATIALSIPLLHSLVDYPLRTLAIAAVCGLLVALLLAPASAAAQPQPPVT